LLCRFYVDIVALDKCTLLGPPAEEESEPEDEEGQFKSFNFFSFEVVCFYIVCETNLCFLEYQKQFTDRLNHKLVTYKNKIFGIGIFTEPKNKIN